jgi:hypothetical protein
MFAPNSQTLHHTTTNSCFGFLCTPWTNQPPPPAALLIHPASSQLQGYYLTDEKGPDDADAFRLPIGTALAPGELRVWCRGANNMSHAFKVGGSDAVSLYDAAKTKLATTGVLGGAGTATSTW